MRVQYRVSWKLDVYEPPKHLLMTLCELKHAKKLYADGDGDMDALDDYLNTMTEWEMDVYICSHVFDGAEHFSPIPGLDELK